MFIKNVMDNEKILKKVKIAVMASTPIKSIDGRALIKDLYRKKNSLLDLSILLFGSSLKVKGGVCL